MPPPSAPIINMWPQCSSNRITFYWSPPSSNGGSPILYYTLQNSSISFTQNVTATSYTVTGLTNGQDYTFTVTATNADGTSAPASLPKVQPGTTPYGPSSASVSTLNTTTALISWVPSTIANEGTIKWYVTEGIPLTYGLSTFYRTDYNYKSTTTITNLMPDTYYTFTVYGVNDVGYSQNRPSNTLYMRSFSPSSISGLQTWWDMSEPGYYTTLGNNVSTILDKSGNNRHLIKPSVNATLPTKGTPINNLSTCYFAPANSLNQATRLDGTTNVFFVGRQNVTNTFNFIFGDDVNYDWHGGSPQWIASAFANAGIYNCSSIQYQNNSSTVSTSFRNLLVTPVSSIFLLNLNSITGQTRFQGLFYDRTFGPTNTSGWVGDFAEIITYSNALTEAQIQSNVNYLKRKWNINSPNT